MLNPYQWAVCTFVSGCCNHKCSSRKSLLDSSSGMLTPAFSRHWCVCLPSSQRSGPIIAHTLPGWPDELLEQCGTALSYPELMRCNSVQCCSPEVHSSPSEVCLFCLSLAYKAAARRTRGHLEMTVIGQACNKLHCLVGCVVKAGGVFAEYAA